MRVFITRPAQITSPCCARSGAALLPGLHSCLCRRVRQRCDAEKTISSNEISGYRSARYDEKRAGFNHIDYPAQTRLGVVSESLWMNFKPPVALHDYSHLGTDYRERERIKRKKARWAAKIERMDRQECLAIMEVLTTEVGGQ